MLFQIFVPLSLVPDVVIFLLARLVLLFRVAALVFGKLGLNLALRGAQLGLELVLLLLPLFHLTLTDEHDVSHFRVHNGFRLRVNTLVIFYFVNLGRLCLRKSSGLASCDLLARLRILLLFDLIYEESTIFSSGEEEARVLGAHKLRDVTFM